jgi:hypothetical protein
VVQTAPGVPPTQTASVIKASLPVEYVFLQEDEINYYRSKRIEHTITQIQLQSDTIEKDTTELQMRLNFINPVKEIFIVIQNRSNVAPDQNDLFNYQNDLLTTQLDFNNETYLDPDVADSLFMYALQAMNRHTRVPNRYIYNYSFALDPENYRPTGQVNMSRIQNKLLTLTVPTSSQVRDVRVYARSYNIIRIENGLAGVLFIDNNTY